MQSLPAPTPHTQLKQLLKNHTYTFNIFFNFHITKPSYSLLVYSLNNTNVKTKSTLEIMIREAFKKSVQDSKLFGELIERRHGHNTGYIAYPSDMLQKI